MPARPTIIYRNIRFKLRRGWGAYYACATWDMRDSRYLHRQMWIDAYGPIPAGHQIHHRDGDREHNALDNYECLSAGDHRRLHREVEDRNPIVVRRRLEGLAKARVAAKRWHRSTAGRVWHRKNAKHVAGVLRRRRIFRNCEYCGHRFKIHFSTDRFCSLKCIASSRYHSGVDDEVRICEWCSSEFTVNKYFKTTCCSRSCGKRAADRRKKARLQSECRGPTGVLRRRIQTVPSA